MIINHNLQANNAIRNMNANSTKASKSMQKLSTGLRINSAGDDAAGLSISEKMRGQISGLDQASSNAQDGISMVQTAEGALNETTSILQRMRQLANQAANGTVTDSDRSSIQDEVNQLTSEINRIGNTTEFNTQKLLNGGIDSNSGDKITQSTSAKETLGAAMANGKTGLATKTLTTDGSEGAVKTATKAKTAAITLKDAASGVKIAAGTKITIDGKVFTNANDITTTAKSGDSDTTATTADMTAIGNAFVAADGTKLSAAATLTATAQAKFTIESKTSGATSSVAVQTEATLTNGADVTSNQGDGTAIVVGGKTFDLSGQNIKVASGDLAGTITALGALTATDGSGVKLSDLVDITGNSTNKTLTFKTKAAGPDATIDFESSAADLALGTKTTDLGVANEAKGNVKVTVDNTTFDLSGVTVNTTSAATKQATIDALKAITSGGTALGDLVDIKYDANNKLVFTDKATGSTSNISFSGNADDALGLTSADIGTSFKGTDTTVEKAGLQAGKALDATADISIAANSTFKIAVGTNSDVTVTLNKSVSPAVYNTSNSDKNVSKAAMDSLVKDLNSALQDAGISDKVTASLSADNKIQFISTTGVDIEVKDGTNNPLASALGFTDKATDMGNKKNIQQVVGPGAQGTGFNTTFQIGANKGQSMSLNISDMRAAALKITGNAGQKGFTKSNGVTNGTTDVKQEAALNVMTKPDASAALDAIDKATTLVSAERGKLGAVQNRLEHTINNLGTASENLTSAESRIRDVDMAKEMSEFSKNNILSQAAQAMLAQANQQPQQVLQLLK